MLCYNVQRLKTLNVKSKIQTKVAAIKTCYFSLSCLFILLTQPALASSHHYFTHSLMPYAQQVKFREQEKSKIFNQEQGDIFGLKYDLGYTVDDWKINFVVEHNQGTLTYIGKTQLGRQITTTTKHQQDIFGASLTRQLIQFDDHPLFYGKLFAFLSATQEKTQRDIHSKGKISGLNEVYNFTLAELGITWQANNIFNLNWLVTLSHSQATSANLSVDFLSKYDTSHIKLNNVYQHQFRVSASYPISKNTQVAVLFDYRKSEIEKSDQYALIKNNENVGFFYQPQRTLQTNRLGLKLTMLF